MAIKVGFVGCGGIAQVHFGILERIEDVRIIAVSDVNRERAEAAAKRFDANVHLNPRLMLEEAQLDALYVCVPPFAHSDVESIAARKGVHLFIEKPINLSLERAQTIAEEIKTAGIITSVGYQWRYMEAVERACELLDDKPIALMLGYWMGKMPGVPWWRVKEKSGGQAVEQTTHIFDLALCFGGEADSVSALGYQGILARSVENFDVEDASSVLVKFRQGAIANIASACIMPEKGNVGLTVLSEGLLVKIGFSGLHVEEKGKVTDFVTRDDPYLAENLAFINALKEGDPSGIKSSYDDALATLAVTLAAGESMQTGKLVTL